MAALDIIAGFIASIIIYNIPLLFGTVGEILNEKAGSLNLGVEGTMAVGAIFGYLIGNWCNSLFMGILAAMFFAALCGMLFAFFTVTLQANQNVTGLTVTTFGLGVYYFVAHGVNKSKAGWPKMAEAVNVDAAFEPIHIPLLSDIPFIGKAFFSHNIFIYLGIVIAIAVWWYMKHTRFGLKLRAVGENPGAADSSGVKINFYKYLHITLGSAIMGIGGYYMALNINGEYLASSGWINGYGWIAVALVIFANWNPAKAILGTFIFGIFKALEVYSDAIANGFPAIFSWMKAIPPKVYTMLPFVITAIVLIISSVRKNKNSGQPAACGVNYYREDR